LFRRIRDHRSGWAVATPGALYRYWRQGQTGGRLALMLTCGTLPGAVVGSVIRVELLPGPGMSDIVVAAVLVPLGLWLVLTTPKGSGARRTAGGRPAAQSCRSGELSVA
jgi:uncharacterized membrane protein YfcA